MSDRTFTSVADPSSEEGARELADMIVTYWRNRGYYGIKASIMKEPSAKGDLWARWSVRSNVGRDGYPPRAMT